MAKRKDVDEPKDGVDKDLTDGEFIALKTTDTDKDSSDSFVKVFVLSAGPEPTESNGFSHEANKAATRQFALQSGLRPTGEVALSSTTEQKRGDLSIGWELTYTVPVQPASKYDVQTEPVHVLAPGESAPANTDQAADDAGTGKPDPQVTPPLS